FRQRWPAAGSAFARSASLSADAADLLAAGDAAALRGLGHRPAEADRGQGHDAPLDAAAGVSLQPDCPTLPVAGLHGLAPALRARLLRAWVRQRGLPPLPASGVDAIGRLLEAREDGAAAFRWADACIRAWRGHLHAMPLATMAPLPAGWARDWDGRAPLALPTGGCLALEGAEGFDAPLRAHARRGGER